MFQMLIKIRHYCIKECRLNNK